MTFRLHKNPASLRWDRNPFHRLLVLLAVLTGFCGLAGSPQNGHAQDEPCCGDLTVKLDEVLANGGFLSNSLSATKTKWLDLPGDPTGVRRATAQIKVTIDVTPSSVIKHDDSVTVTATFEHMAGPPVYCALTVAGYGPPVSDTHSYSNTPFSLGNTKTVTATHTLDFYRDVKWGINGDGNAYKAFAHITAPSGRRSNDWDLLQLTAIFTCEHANEDYPDTPDTPDPPSPDCHGGACGGSSFLSGSDPGATSFCPLSQVTSNGRHVDFSAASQGNGCSSCGAGGAGGAPFEVVRLFHMDRTAESGSCSPGVFFGNGIDTRLMFYVKPDGKHIAILFDPDTGNRFRFEDSGFTGTYTPELAAYFHPFSLVKDDDSAVRDPNYGLHHDAFATITRRNGLEYKFEIAQTPFSDGEIAGRVTSIKTADGYSQTFAYKTWTGAELAASPDRQYQLDSVTDSRGYSADFTYSSTKRRARWVIEAIDINSGLYVLEYDYSAYYVANPDFRGPRRVEVKDHIKQVTGKSSTEPSQVVSTYKYFVDTYWDTPAIKWDQRLSGSDQANDTVYLSGFYTVRGYPEMLDFSYVGKIMGRSNGADERYLVISYNENGLGKHEIDYRDLKIEWEVGRHWKYYNPSTSAYETSYANHPGATPSQIETGTLPVLIDATGYSVDVTYDSGGKGNVTKKEYANASDYEAWDYDSQNQVTKYRNRNGDVTLTERNTDNRVVRLVGGLTDVDGDGTYTVEAEANQQISGYYPSGHANAGMLKWEATGAYVVGAVVEPAVNERTDYVYNASQQLTKIIKPLPTGQSTRPEVLFSWANGQTTSTTNESGQVTSYTYDRHGQLVKTLYPDQTTEEVWRDQANLKVYRKDRVGLVSCTTRDAANRTTSSISSYGSDSGTILDEAIATVFSAANQPETKYYYQSKHTTPYRVTSNGTDQEYFYDFRGRRVETRNYTASSSYQTSKTTYVNNILFSSRNEFPGYSRTTYSGYSADRSLIRTITCRTPSITFADNSAILAANRSNVPGPDPDYVINDAVRDLHGNVVELINGRGCITLNKYDSLGRPIESTRGLKDDGQGGYDTTLALLNKIFYNAKGQATKTTDPALADTVFSYDSAGNVSSRTAASGTTHQLGWSYTYDERGRKKTETAPGTAVTSYFYDDCCGNVRGSTDPEGLGSIQVANGNGQSVYQAAVKDTFDFANDDFKNPSTSDTISESTTRYDALGRTQYTTRWKTALTTAIDVTDPPIAGVDGVSTTNGITTQYAYLDRVDDPATAQITINRLGSGTATIDLEDLFLKLQATVANGGAATSFVPLNSTAPAGRASASIVISPDEKVVRVSISDGQGRGVASAMMTGPAATTPNSLIHWSLTQHDQVETLVGFGDVERICQNWADGSQRDGGQHHD